MKLPADPDQWTDRHLERVEAALWRQFDLYEKYSGVDDVRADTYYSEAQRLSEQATHLRIVLNRKPVMYPC
jgi:hypothetical protein